LLFSTFKYPTFLSISGPISEAESLTDDSPGQAQRRPGKRSNINRFGPASRLTRSFLFFLLQAMKSGIVILRSGFSYDFLGIIHGITPYDLFEENFLTTH